MVNNPKSRINVSLNNELTLTIQHIDVTQTTTEKLRDKKKLPETKLQQADKEK